MSLYRNKYRIESARWRNWDYANAGAYFVTICTKDRLHYLGDIIDPMVLSDIGKMVDSEWTKTPSIRPNMNLELGAYVVMPNHFHAIIIIGKNEFNSTVVQTPCLASPDDDGVSSDAITSSDTKTPFDESNGDEMQFIDKGTHGNASDIHDDSTGKETHGNASLPADLPGPQRKNLASIIRGFKSAVTVQARSIDPAFGWQSRYHDHVIRNYDEFVRIENYIINNPANWTKDKLHR